MTTSIARLRRNAAKTALACVSIFLVACQNPAPRQDLLNTMQETVEAGRAAAAAAPAPVPEEISRALVPSLQLDDRKLAAPKDETRFDIAVNEVPAQQFFMSLVDGTHYNVVVHPDVGGKISLSLKNVTIPEVIAAARDVYGYEFEHTPYGLQILPSRLEARVFQINYLNINRSGSSSTFVSAGTLQRGHHNNSNQDSGQSDQQAGNNNSSSNDRNSDAVGTQINTKLPETSFSAGA